MAWTLKELYYFPPGTQLILRELTNNFERLPFEFHLADLYWRVPRLAVLKLESCGLMVLDANIGRFVELKELHLYGNRLKTLPVSIGNLNHLRTLNLRGNKLIWLPDEIGNLVSLDDLNLDDNHLASLPASLGRLKGLASLNIAENRFTTLPSFIGGLRLATFWAYDNPLVHFPYNLGMMTKRCGTFEVGTPPLLYPKRPGETSLEHLRRCFPIWINRPLRAAVGHRITYANLSPSDLSRLPRHLLEEFGLAHLVPLEEAAPVRLEIEVTQRRRCCCIS